MDWYRVPTVATAGPDWLDIAPALRGHWLALMSYCALHETGGLLEGAASWDRRRWDRVAAMERADADALVECGLAAWSGQDLVVALYDPDQEARASVRKESAAKAARARWDTVRHVGGEADPADASRNAPRNASRNASRNAPRICVGKFPHDAASLPRREEKRREERKGEEEKGEERCGEESGSPQGGSPAAAPPDDVPPPDEKQKRQKPEPSAESQAVAERLAEEVAKALPDLPPTKQDIGKWARDIDLAMRRDGATAEQLLAVLDHVYRGQGGWWRSKVQSGASLRKHLRTLLAQARQPELPRAGGQNKGMTFEEIMGLGVRDDRE